MSSVCHAKCDFIGVTEQKNADTGKIKTEFIERHTSCKQVRNWNADQCGDTGREASVHICCRQRGVVTGRRDDHRRLKRTEDWTV